MKRLSSFLKRCMNAADETQLSIESALQVLLTNTEIASGGVMKQEKD